MALKVIKPVFVRGRVELVNRVGVTLSAFLLWFIHFMFDIKNLIKTI